jgi:hypothetical protein
MKPDPNVVWTEIGSYQSPTIRCNNCRGILYGNPKHTGDFRCQCVSLPTPVKVGWVCPLCKKSNSPHINQCDCK